MARPAAARRCSARAVAHECEAAFIYVSGPEIIQKFYGESEARLRKIFEDARRRAPCIIFFDEIDSLAPKRERVEGEVEKRVVAQLLALMDGLKSRGDVDRHGGDQPAEQHRSGLAPARTVRPRDRHRHPQRSGAARNPGNLRARHAARRRRRSRRTGRHHARLHRRRPQCPVHRSGDGGIASPAAGAAIRVDRDIPTTR